MTILCAHCRQPIYGAGIIVRGVLSHTWCRMVLDALDSPKAPHIAGFARGGA